MWPNECKVSGNVPESYYRIYGHDNPFYGFVFLCILKNAQSYE